MCSCGSFRLSAHVGLLAGIEDVDSMSGVRWRRRPKSLLRQLTN